MYAYIKLLNGYQKSLLYHVPDTIQQHTKVGTLVRIPLQNRSEIGVITLLFESQPSWARFEIKDIDAIETIPNDPLYWSFLQKLESYYCIESSSFVRRMRQFVAQKTVRERANNTENVHEYEPKNVQLTDEQQTVCNFITPKISTPEYCPVLLHGVTGSGKTEVYLKLIEQAAHTHKSTLLLLPEVTLALQFERILRKRLPRTIPLYGFHSGATPKEKRHLWKDLLANTPLVIIGVHLPILLPIHNLGFIIVDEEHETGYQEKKHPKINSKEAALIRAKLYNIPILLGSATPSISSLYNVKQRDWHFFQLKKRFAGSFPHVQTVMLRNHRQRKNFWISNELHQAITNRLSKKEQTIIFINRRGYSFFVQCKECSFLFECGSCSVSLTLHNENKLACHYCGHHQILPSTCPSCKAPEKSLLKKGVGTQQVTTILRKLFPSARVERADLDTTTKKKNWEKTLGDFQSGSIDILVGTQTISKGYDFPGVTLVGILWADLNLHFPMYNACETTIQQIIQVAGRAGRHTKESNVIVQTMTDHPILTCISEKEYLTFYNNEIKSRSEVCYPPCVRFAEIEIKHENEELLEREAMTIMLHLLSLSKKYQNTRILGPAKPPVHKVKRVHARKLYLKAKTIDRLTTLFKSIDHTHYKSRIFFTPNPLQ